MYFSSRTGYCRKPVLIYKDCKKIKDVIKAGGGVTKFIGNLVPAFKVARSEWGYSISEAIGYAVKTAAQDAGPELISRQLVFLV